MKHLQSSDNLMRIADYAWHDRGFDE